MKVQEFIEKLNKVQFTHADTKELRGTVYNGVEVKVTYHTKLASMIQDLKDMPIQMVIRLEIGGAHAMSYGAVDNSDNTALVEFFVKTTNRVMEEQMKEENKNRDQAQELFENL
jgi:hypothetical protein